MTTPRCSGCGAPATHLDLCHRKAPVCHHAAVVLGVGHQLAPITRASLGLPELPRKVRVA